MHNNFRRILPIWTICTALVLFSFAAHGAIPPEGEGLVDHDITKAAVVDRAILAIMENYYDPTRVESPKMFKSAMDVVQVMVPEVKVVQDEKNQVNVVEVLDKKLKVKFDQVRSPWGLSKSIRRVFKFLKANLPEADRDYRMMEYAVVNGLLSVLDPHTSAMMPDQWAELRMAIRGEFEGVGIRITTDRRPPCDGDLTVVEVFDGTPAQRAGVKKGDKILKIDGESTVNITTSEAADRLRGKPGTSVSVEVRRVDGTRKKLSVSRGKIPIDSVKWELLKGDVAYLSLDSFSDNSATEVQGALHALHTKKMKGLIFDLRGNPGGSLDVAIEIANLFLNGGTIVTTAGRYDEDRDVANASSKGTEPAYPLVVLIDQGSASAAEILAGAVRNHGRALLVGERTFGKGSVQRIMPLPAGGAMRITTAQYLTPGDISIQAVGVAPDVQFTPVIVDREELNLDSSTPLFSEADLDAHLNRPNALERSDRPGALSYLTHLSPADRKADRKMFERCYAENPDYEFFITRHQKEFARRLVAGAKGITTAELLLSARDILDDEEKEQESAVAKALKKLGVDWSPTPEGKRVEPAEDGSVSATAQIKGAVVPGKKFRLLARVKNGSSKPIHRLRATTASDNPLFAGREMVFGKVRPGKTQTWEAVVEVPRVFPARVDPVTINFAAESGPIPAPVSIDVGIPERPRSKLAYSWHLEDLGNGNGMVEAGEELLMRVELTNIGDRKTFEMDAALSAKPGVDVKKGHFEVPPLAPGKTARGEFKLEMARDLPLEKAELRFMAQEWVPAKRPITRTLLVRELKLDIQPASPRPSSASGTITVRGGRPITLYDTPSLAGRVVASAPAGASFKIDARMKNFFRVVLAEKMHAWIAETDTSPGGSGKPRYTLAVIRPPEVHIEGESVRSTTAGETRVSGWAEHAQGVKDLIVFVGDRKVAYLQNSEKGSTRLDFQVVVPLEEGANQVVLIARHSDEVADTKEVFVRRAKP